MSGLGDCLPLLRLAIGRTGAAGAALWVELDGSLELRASAGVSDLTGGRAEQARSVAAERLAGTFEPEAGSAWRAVPLPGVVPAALTLLAPAAPDDDGWAELRLITEVMAAHLVLAARLAQTERDWRDEFTQVQRISGVGSWSWDMLTQEVRWSEKMFYLLGLLPTRDKPSLAATLERVAMEDRGRLLAAIDEACATGRHFELEHDILHDNGDRRTVSTHGRIVPSLNGTGNRAILTMQDLTDRIQVARELKAASARAETQAETKTRLLAHISHEIRTPLNAVLGFADLLAQTELDARQRRHLGVIRETGALLLSVVNDLLDLAKIEAKRISIERAAFAVEPLLEAARAMIEVLLGTKDVCFILEQGPEVPPWLLGDATRIKQILANLLGNAAKFTTSGTIRLRVCNLTPGATTARLRFEVVDTGIGIPAAQHQELFKRFVQLGEHKGRRFGGTGLGLAICRELIELMEGSIGVESNIGQGSVFWFELPLPEAAPSDQPPAAVTHAAPPRPLSVLVVDDVETNRHLIQALLELDHHRVSMAKDGNEAIAAVRRSLPDIVLMDVNMPELDGLEATQAIRQLGGPFTGLPIIAMTARALPADVAACLAAGMNGYLAKPIDPQGLSRALAKAVPERPPPEPVLALPQLQSLAASLGLEALRSLIHGMLARVRNDCAVIEAALGREDSVTVRDAAHRLAGLCGSLGAPSLSGIARAIEEAAEDRRIAECGPLLAELDKLAKAADAEFADVCNALAASRDNADPGEHLREEPHLAT